MLSENEVFNEIMILPPVKRNKILKTLGFGEEKLAPHPCCKHNPYYSEFFFYVSDDRKLNIQFGMTLSSYLATFDDDIMSFSSDNECIQNIVLKKENLISTFHIIQNDMLNIGWDGDYSQQPRVIILCCSEIYQYELCFVWKQHRSSLSFIASSKPLSRFGEPKIKKGSPRFITDKYRYHIDINTKKGEAQ
jgi:hypothetical protein